MLREPIDLPPIVSVEFIEIKDKTYIPYAPKAREIIDKVKEEKKRVVSEQAPPAAKAKEKPDRIPMPDDKKEKKELVKKKQNPEEIKHQIRQATEFEKTIYNDVPNKFEAGTPNISGAIVIIFSLVLTIIFWLTARGFI